MPPSAMKPKPNPSIKATPLRRRAEVLLHKLAKEKHSGAGVARSPADTQRLLHELQVHQIELEMQNEELQQARAEIEAGLEQYSDLYDFAPVGYVTLGHEGAIREANLTAASLLGIPRSQLVKQRLEGFVAPADRPLFNAFFQQIFASKERSECEVQLLVKNKPPANVLLRANLFDSGLACRVTLSDITLHKQAEEDRLVIQKLESTGILAGGLAHDFNNLLTVIILNLDLSRMLPPSGGQLASLLGNAKHAALLAHELTQQLITFADGGMPVRKPSRLSGVIQESARLALNDSSLPCEFSLVDDLWVVEADSSQIGQVIRNMILNAREAMPEGGAISVRLENAVLASPIKPSLPSGKYIRVSIADQGGGIAQEVLPKIFDPYFSTKQRGVQKGMGLGLTICHAVIRKHGGAITVDSEVGVGTTFHIYLPTLEPVPGDEKSARPKNFARRVGVATP